MEVREGGGRLSNHTHIMTKVDGIYFIASISVLWEKWMGYRNFDL